MGFLGTTVKNSTDITDEVLANNMLAGEGAKANAYLMAAMASPTPELRALYSAALSQVIQGYAAVTELATYKGWEKPYDSPAKQLSDTYAKAQATVRKDG